ncbi:PhzF family phenazine biosynthesis protein [Herbiconiux daphne]|uniref:PhzF family phenazine biosynthesis protein n=1 Tax=Herbiconiux daphne TaxID=2970914 RepID=A0ABT2H2C2_9MICO|nr:PhzF family phenazine biosynthesis protein [Herbiconiux daphne]MCS5734064.1 PhzF family phenazine biosynthesis protein [Herbiconiux daphne]
MESHTLVDVVSVFADQNGAFGNPLGILWSTPDTRGREQQIATTLGFSETVFVDEIVEHAEHAEPVEHVGHDEGGDHPDGADRATQRLARIRIFTPARELPFAGHPCVGTAWWLAAQGRPAQTLQVAAGDVAVRYDGDITWITGRASWAPAFEWHELGSAAEVDALDAGAFVDGEHYAWAYVDEASGHLRSRMFAPALGVPEDEATGAAAVRLTALLGRDLAIDQGVGSRLLTRHLGGEEVSVGGRTVRSTPVDLALP